MRGGTKPRRSVWLGSVVTAALTAAALSAMNSAAVGEQGRLSLSYECASAGRAPGAGQDVTVGFEQRYPGSGTPGAPIRPGALTATVTVPRAGVTALLPGDTAAVTGTADLTARVTQGASRATADWAGLTAARTGVPDTGDLVLVFTGNVPAVSVSGPGDVTFAMGDLVLSLAPRPGNPSSATPSAAPVPGSTSPSVPEAAAPSTPSAASASTPSAGSPSAAGTPSGPSGPSGSGSSGGVTVTCVPAAGAATTLATVPVPGGPAPSAASGPSAVTPGASGGNIRPHATAGGGPGTDTGTITVTPEPTPPHSGITTCGKTPTGALDPKRLPPVSQTAIVLPLPGMPDFPPSPQCAFADGFSNVGKLGGAMIVNDPYAHPALAEINSGRRKVLDYTNQYVEVDSILSLQLPPSRATFVTYGFMPTSARVDFVPRGLFTVVQTGDDFFGQPILTTIGGYQDIRLHDVRINGTPLDVGRDCHTVRPLDIVLNGRKDAGLPDDDGKPDYDIQDGGPLTDDNLVIPPFTGCAAHGEDLNALFTAALSGPGNSLNLVQGRICDPLNAPYLCQPEIPIPQLPHRK
ncbi:DUF6801 domain-containing protein [Streptomyces sp. HPF1205]|uniref:DUF6801 domain-containing protein n=1 Tax=Streptomyces sp. HPF1205 TaxID=2873262 RepID=UPI0021F22CD6|nr:DUF6801 domain-containing protein [Streptomyces sp. HPF1205]